MRAEPDRGCRGAREWLSAHRDGEAPHDEVIAAHVTTCAACRAWAAVADDVTRRSRVQVADSPEVVTAALAQWPAQWPQPRAEAGERSRQAVVGRWLLGVAAAVGIALAVMGLVRDAAGAHATIDLLAFEGALAVGFGLAARDPDRYSAALLPVVALVTILTLLPGAADAAAGGLDAVAEASHLSLWLGLVGLLLVLDARRTRIAPRRPPVRPRTARMS